MQSASINMQDSRIAAALERLLQTLSRSLAAYLQYAHLAPGDARIATALERMAQEQERDATAVAEALAAAGGVPAVGPFPMRFAALHDLAPEYMCAEVLARHRQDLKQIESAAEALSDDPALRTLAVGVLSRARAHLEVLQGLAGKG